MDVKAVILAAGESSRFWPLSEDRHKSIIKVCGKPIILWAIESLIKAGIENFIIVQSPRRDVEKVLSEYPVSCNIEYVIQERPNGAGEALEKAKELIEDHFLVLNPNHFNAGEFVVPMLEMYAKKGLNAVLLGVETSEPWNYGVFKFRDGKPIEVVEKPERGEQPSNVRIAGIYLLPESFFEYHAKVRGDHYSLERALSLMLKEEEVGVYISDKSTAPSLKYAWHLLDFTRELMKYYIKRPLISESAKISEKATIEGNVVIEDGAKIYENAVIKGPCYIGRGTVVGNNTLIRESHLGSENLVGASAEIARSVFLDDVHVHSGYFGDTILAEGVRVGAGTIFANRRLDRQTIKSIVKGKVVDTKRDSLGAIVGPGTKIGVNCSIMPGIIIGANCEIWPASVVYKNLESNTCLRTRIEYVYEVRKDAD